MDCDCLTVIKAFISCFFPVLLMSLSTSHHLFPVYIPSHHIHISDLTPSCTCWICGHKILSPWLQPSCLHKEETHSLGPCKIIPSVQGYLAQYLCNPQEQINKNNRASRWQGPLYMLQILFQKFLRKHYVVQGIVLASECNRVRCFLWAKRKLTQKWTTARSLIWHLGNKLLTTQPESIFSLLDLKNKDHKSYTGAAGRLIIGAKSNESFLASSQFNFMILWLRYKNTSIH